MRGGGGGGGWNSGPEGGEGVGQQKGGGRGNEAAQVSKVFSKTFRFGSKVEIEKNAFFGFGCIPSVETIFHGDSLSNFSN